MSKETNNTKFRFSIDRGGTFTDIYAEVSQTFKEVQDIIKFSIVSKMK